MVSPSHLIISDLKNGADSWSRLWRTLHRCSSAGVLMSERNCSAGWNTLDGNFRTRLISRRPRYVSWREHMGISAVPGIQRWAIISNVFFVLSMTVVGTIYRGSAAVFWSLRQTTRRRLGDGFRQNSLAARRCGRRTRDTSSTALATRQSRRRMAYAGNDNLIRVINRRRARKMLRIISKYYIFLLYSRRLKPFIVKR